MLRDHRIHALGTPEEVMTPENMKAVFNVDAELIFDEKIGKHTVLLHDSYNAI
jgi:iron complex transport system ATP-binding protein